MNNNYGYAIRYALSKIALFQVEGLMSLMEGDHIGPFNLGNPGEFTMLELAIQLGQPR